MILVELNIQFKKIMSISYSVEEYAEIKLMLPDHHNSPLSCTFHIGESQKTQAPAFQQTNAQLACILVETQKACLSHTSNNGTILGQARLNIVELGY